jgi:hypothetical protein
MLAAYKQIDDMAAQGTLDPAFLLTMAKAYSGVKDSQYTKDEVKEVMYHLYMKAKETASRQQPPEIRILKHLLSIDDPAHRRDEMEKAFQKVGAHASGQALCSAVPVFSMSCAPCSYARPGLSWTAPLSSAQVIMR